MNVQHLTPVVTTEANVQIVPTVGPELAGQWLSKLHPSQRKLRKEHVRAIADAMSSGTFRWTGDPIRFDRNGKLIDGQHRLRAVIASGHPMTNVVVITVPDNEAVLYIDQQTATRSARDAAGFLGVKIPSNTVFSALLQELHEFDSSNFRRVQKPVRVHKVLEHPFLAAVSRIHSADSGRLLPAAVLGAAARCMRVAPEQAEAFFTSLATNDHAGESGMYTHTFAQFLIREKGGGIYHGVRGKHSIDRSRRMADRAIRCWNAYRTGSPYNRVQAGSGLNIPTPV